jgi:hypothetical protein
LSKQLRYHGGRDEISQADCRPVRLPWRKLQTRSGKAPVFLAVTATYRIWPRSNSGAGIVYPIVYPGSCNGVQPYCSGGNICGAATQG